MCKSHITRLVAKTWATLEAVGTVFRYIPLRCWQALVVVTLLVLMAHSAAQLFWLLAPLPEPVAPARPLFALQASARANTAAIDINTVKSLPLFGVATEHGPVAPVTLPEVEMASVDTQLSLTLQGVINSSEPAAARAIVSHQARQQVYAPGDALPGGQQVTLIRVMSDRVILNNGGRYESLWLYEGEPEAGRVAAANRSEGAVAKPRRDDQPSQPPVVAAKEAVATLADVIRITVAREGDQVIGYRIQPGRDRRLFDQFGFRADDIVTHVNGVSLRDASKAMSVYREIRSARAANFELLRNGKAVTLDVALDDNNV